MNLLDMLSGDGHDDTPYAADIVSYLSPRDIIVNLLRVCRATRYSMTFGSVGGEQLPSTLCKLVQTLDFSGRFVVAVKNGKDMLMERNLKHLDDAAAAAAVRLFSRSSTVIIGRAKLDDAIVQEIGVALGPSITSLDLCGSPIRDITGLAMCVDLRSLDL